MNSHDTHPFSTFILSPSRDGRYCSGFVQGLTGAQGHPAFTGWINLEHESDIARARGRLATLGLERTQARGFLFIDDDMVWTVRDFDAVIEAAKLGCAIVGGLYAKRRVEGGEVANPLDGERHPQCAELELVREIGTGFLWVSREVFEQMRRWAPKIGRGENAWHHFFQAGAEKLSPAVAWEYLSEDYAFCRLAAASGFDVWLHRGIRLGHVGTQTFWPNAESSGGAAKTL